MQKKKVSETPFRNVLFEWFLIFLLGAVPFGATIWKESNSLLESVAMGVFGGAVLFILFTVAGSE